MRGADVARAAIALVLATAAGGAPAGSLPPVPPLVARRVIACGDFAGDLVDLAWHGGRIHLLDAQEGVIWSLDRDGGGREALEVGGLRPQDLFFGCGGALYVVDPWDRTLRCRAPDGVWATQPTGYRIFHGDGDAAGIALGGPRDGASPLAALVDCDGDTLRCGTPYQVPHRYPSVTANANYAQVAVGDSLLVIAHLALGHLRVHARDGRELGRFTLRGPEPEAVRRWYRRSLASPPEEPLSIAPDTLLADLVRAAAPETFPVPVYVSDVAIRGGRLHVVVGGALQVYDARGDLLARHEFAGDVRGERVIVHRICFAADGSLLGLDAAHYHRIYDFGPLPGAAAVSTERSEERECNEGSR